MAIEHPAEVDTLVDTARQSHYFRIVTKTLANGKNTTQQQSRINRRYFAVPTSLTSLRIEPVIKPAALLVGTRVEEAQGVKSTLLCLGFFYPVSIGSNAE